LPGPRSPPASPSRTGLAQSTRWPARLPAAHPTRGGTASLGCSGCSDRGSRFRSSRGFRVRHHRGRARRQPPCGRPLPGRGAPPSSTKRGTSPWTPSRSTGGGAGRSAQAISARFQRTQAQFRYLASITRSRTWVMEMRFVMRCAATASLRWSGYSICAPPLCGATLKPLVNGVSRHRAICVLLEVRD